MMYAGSDYYELHEAEWVAEMEWVSEMEWADEMDAKDAESRETA